MASRVEDLPTLPTADLAALVRRLPDLIESLSGKPMPVSTAVLNEAARGLEAAQ